MTEPLRARVVVVGAGPAGMAAAAAAAEAGSSVLSWTRHRHRAVRSGGQARGAVSRPPPVDGSIACIAPEPGWFRRPR